MGVALICDARSEKVLYQICTSLFLPRPAPIIEHRKLAPVGICFSMIVRVTSAKSYGEVPRQRKWALLVAVLFHGAVFWLVIQPRPFLLEKKRAEGNESQPIWLAPPPARPPAPPVVKAKPPVVRPSRPQVRPLNTITLPQLPRVVQAEPSPSPTPTITPTPTQEPVEDMMAQVEAARKRRAQARPQEDTEAPESDNQRAVRQAQTNLANLQAKAKSAREQHGGVFSLGKMSSFKGEFTFNGWNQNLQRQWPRLVEVELGNERDIETAIIKSMIVQIRKERSAEFNWESHRLGRIVPLNARPEYTAQLQAFLMKEFFPDYRPSPR